MKPFLWEGPMPLEFLPAEDTSASQERQELASQLMRSCPLELAPEAALIGSAAWGAADPFSDIDLVLWGESLPSASSVHDWLIRAGVGELRRDLTLDRNSLGFTGVYTGIPLEMSCLTFNSQEAILEAVLGGETSAREQVIHAWNLYTARPLRSHGWLEAWQIHLDSYPDLVQKKLVLQAVEFWRHPHRVQMPWVLARREALLGLMEWLLADLKDAMRVLFAANRCWEPDWKNLALASDLLERKPARLIERVRAALVDPDLEKRVHLAQSLMLEILELAPAADEIGEACQNLRASLTAHPLAETGAAQKGELPHFTRLETDRLIVRRFGEADLATFLAYRNDPEIARYQSWTQLTATRALAFFHSLDSQEPGTPGKWFQFAVELKTNGEQIGEVGLFTADSAREAEIGYTFASAYHGQGFATESVRAVLNYAFGVLELHRITATVDVDNQASIRLLERLGMRQEAYNRQSYWDGNHWSDEYRYALLDKEWPS
jgi:RimJ/RimL family protein N-acetyltransferase